MNKPKIEKMPIDDIMSADPKGMPAHEYHKKVVDWITKSGGPLDKKNRALAAAQTHSKNPRRLQSLVVNYYLSGEGMKVFK